MISFIALGLSCSFFVAPRVEQIWAGKSKTEKMLKQKVLKITIEFHTFSEVHDLIAEV